jgi:hypothetical protein
VLKPERAKETLAVGDRQVECTVRKRRFEGSDGGPTVTEWLSPTVPGGVVQLLSVQSIGATENVLRVFVAAFGGPP